MAGLLRIQMWAHDMLYSSWTLGGSAGLHQATIVHPTVHGKWRALHTAAYYKLFLYSTSLQTIQRKWAVQTSRRSRWTSCPGCGGWGRSWYPGGLQCWKGVEWDHKSAPGRVQASPCVRWSSAQWGSGRLARDLNSGVPGELQRESLCGLQLAKDVYCYSKQTWQAAVSEDNVPIPTSILFVSANKDFGHGVLLIYFYFTLK